MSYEEEKQDRKIERLEIKIEWLQDANTNFVHRICDQAQEIERLRAYAKKWECEFPCSEEKWCNRQNLCKRMGDLDDTVANQAARIQELEDALVEKQTALMPSAPRCYANARRQAAIEQLQAEGKIGPDAKPRSWQITDERRRAIAILMVASNPEKIGNFDFEEEEAARAVLRAMLEAGQ